jgi:hypothetical protein
VAAAVVGTVMAVALTAEITAAGVGGTGGF